jgi:hypothetical protein
MVIDQSINRESLIYAPENSSRDGFIHSKLLTRNRTFCMFLCMTVEVSEVSFSHAEALGHPDFLAIGPNAAGRKGGG